MTIPSTFIKKVSFIFLLFIGTCQMMSAYTHQLDTLKDKSSDTLKALSEKYRYSNPDLAKAYAQEFLTRGLKKNDLEAQSDAYYHLGLIAQVQGKYQVSISDFDKGIKISESNSDFSRLALLIKTKGNSYFYLNDYNNALLNYQKALDIAGILKNRTLKITTDLNIALIKKKIGQFEEAIEIERRNFRDLKKSPLKDANIIANLLINMSSTFLNLKENDSAIYYCKTGLKAAIDEKNLERISYFYNTLGVAYYRKGAFKMALDYYFKAISIIKTLKNKKRLASTYFLIGESYFKQEDFDNAEIYLKLAEENFIAIDDLSSEDLIDTYKLLAQIYTANNNTLLSNSYFEKYVKLDSIYDSNKAGIIGNLYQKDIQKKDEQLVKLSKQKSRLSFLNIIGLTFLGVSLLLMVIFIVRWKRNKKKMEILLKQTSKKERNSTQPVKIADEKVNDILKRLALIEKSNFFLKDNFSLNLLSKKIKTNATYLSQVINTYKKQTFSEYTNELRINYALKRLKEDAKFRSYSINHIASELGYKSQDSFSRHFKKQTGIYPSFYISKITNF